MYRGLHIAFAPLLAPVLQVAVKPPPDIDKYPVLTLSARGWNRGIYFVWLDISEPQQQRRHMTNAIAKVADADVFVGGMHP